MSARHCISGIVVRRGIVDMSARLKDVHAARTALGRAKACAHLSLQPHKSNEREIAPDVYQIDIGEPFFEWEVIGKAFLKPVINGKGEIEKKPRTPCRCSCGTERDVDTFKLRGLLTRSCGHKLSAMQRKQNREDWRKRASREKKKTPA